MIYLAVLFILLALSYELDFGKRRRYWSFWYYASLVVFICLAGFRYRLGGDTLIYMKWFEDVPELSNFKMDPFGYEFGFVILASAVKTIGGTFYLFQLLVAGIFNIAFFRFARKNCYDAFFMCLSFYFFVYYYFLCFEVMRESIAVAVFLQSIPYLLQRKYSIYYLFCFLALLFHYSSLFMLVLPACRSLKLNRYSLSLLVVILMSYTLLNALFREFSFVFAFNNRLAAIVDFYTNNDLYNQAGGMSLKGYISQCFIPILATILPLYYYKKWSDEDNPQHEFLIVLMILTQACIVGIAIFYRFTNYLFPFAIVCTAKTLLLLMYRLRTGVNRFMLIVLGVILPYFSFHFLSIYNHKMYGQYNKYYMFYPYHSLFNEGTIPPREMIYQIGVGI